MSTFFFTEINGSGAGPQNATWEWDGATVEQVNNVSMRLDEGDTLQIFIDPGLSGGLETHSFKLTRISDEMPP